MPEGFTVPTWLTADLVALVIPLVGFWLCFGGLLARAEGRAGLRARTRGEWLLDGVNLGVQGWLVPLGAGWLGTHLWARVLPAGSLPLGAFGGFVVAFVGVDLLYYLNHRALHAVAWPIHAVHHAAPRMDVLVSARNTAWTTAFLVYPWASSLFLHVLDVRSGYLVGAALTAALDLWRHSGLDAPLAGRFGLVTPRLHAWHHAPEVQDRNFGANWTWWDRLFGTFHDPGTSPERVGIPTGLSTWRELVWPFPGEALRRGAGPPPPQDPATGVTS